MSENEVGGITPVQGFCGIPAKTWSLSKPVPLQTLECLLRIEECLLRTEKLTHDSWTRLKMLTAPSAPKK